MERAVIDKICEMQRRIDMEERLMGDCVIILSELLSDGYSSHRTVEYDDRDIGQNAKAVIDMVYKLSKKLAQNLND